MRDIESISDNPYLFKIMIRQFYILLLMLINYSKYILKYLFIIIHL